MNNPFAIIKTISFTEKSNLLAENLQYTFIVDQRASKPQIRTAVEKIFEREVSSVNVLHRKGKRKRNRFGWGKKIDTKRAIVTLKGGQDPLELF